MPPQLDQLHNDNVVKGYEIGSHRLVASSLPVFSIYTCSHWNQGKSIKPTAAAAMTSIPVYQSVSTTHCMMVHTCLMWVP